MLLAAQRKLDDSCRAERGAPDDCALVGQDLVIHLQAAAANLAPRLAGRGDQPGAHESRERAQPGVGQARRAWLTRDDVLNTRTWKQIEKLRKKR